MSRPRAVVATAVLGLVLALAGCNDDDPGAGADPTTSPSATSSDTPSESPSDTASDSPSVTPASGPELKMPSATMHAPKGWKKLDDLVDFQTQANSPDFISSVSLSALEYAGPTLPLELQAKAVLKSHPRLKRLPDQEIDGVTFVHVGGRRDEFTHSDVYSVRDNGYETSIEFGLNAEMSPAEREQLIAEGLASFSWS